MARGCTCALFSSGPAFLKIFPAAAARRFKSPGRSRQFPSGGNRALFQANNRKTCIATRAQNRYNFDKVNLLCWKAKNTSAFTCRDRSIIVNK